jgi:uncharacterized RDD family membrane protein YckC
MRVLAFGIDAIALGLIAVSGGQLAKGGSYFLVGSVAPGEAAFGLVGPVVLLVGYFAFLWAVLGSTPGLRLVGLAIESAGGGRLRPWPALLRAVVVYGPIGVGLGLPPPGGGLSVAWLSLLFFLELEGLGFGDRCAHSWVVVASSPLPRVPRIPGWVLGLLVLLMLGTYAGNLAGGLAEYDGNDIRAGAFGGLAGAVAYSDLVFLITYLVYRATSWAESVPRPT